MRFKRLFIFSLVLTLHLSCNEGTDTRDARNCADTFHYSFRLQDYDAIYSNASERFQKVRTRAEYVSMMKDIYEQYGEFLKAKELSVGVTVNTETGRLDVLVFEVDFKKAKATERLTFNRDQNGRMRLWMFELS